MSATATGPLAREPHTRAERTQRTHELLDAARATQDAEERDRLLDEVVLTNRAVAEAVCFGVPHGTWGEEVAAAVVLREPATEAELLAYCREHLADYKRPKQIHITDAIPRTATGKIQRGVVAKTYKIKAS